MKPVVFLPEAEQEMLETAIYYQSHASGLGVDYLSEVEHAAQVIAKSPIIWPIVEGKLRKCLVRRYPFGILYCVNPKEIIIVAVAHLRRRPSYRKRRM
jgi:hypothetical protein